MVPRLGKEAGAVRCEVRLPITKEIHSRAGAVRHKMQPPIAREIHSKAGAVGHKMQPPITREIHSKAGRMARMGMTTLLAPRHISRMDGGKIHIIKINIRNHLVAPVLRIRTTRPRHLVDHTTTTTAFTMADTPKIIRLMEFRMDTCKDLKRSIDLILWTLKIDKRVS